MATRTLLIVRGVILNGDAINSTMHIPTMRNLIETVSFTADRLIRSVRVQDIDMDDVARHFDLPHDNLRRREMLRVLQGTKRGFIDLFKGMTYETLYRGVEVERLESALVGEEGVGCSWTTNSFVAKRFADMNDGVVLTANVNLSDVNWSLTIGVNALSEGEEEIVLNAGVEIQLLGLDHGIKTQHDHQLPTTIFT